MRQPCCNHRESKRHHRPQQSDQVDVLHSSMIFARPKSTHQFHLVGIGYYPIQNRPPSRALCPLQLEARPYSTTRVAPVLSESIIGCTHRGRPDAESMDARVPLRLQSRVWDWRAKIGCTFWSTLRAIHTKHANLDRCDCQLTSTA